LCWEEKRWRGDSNSSGSLAIWQRSYHRGKKVRTGKPMTGKKKKIAEASGSPRKERKEQN